MATLNKLRRKGLVVFIVLVALIMFIIGDYFGQKNTSQEEQFVGKIGKEKISYNEFNSKLDNIISNYERNGQMIDDNNKEQISSMIWNQMVQKKLVNVEYDKVGIDVSKQEGNELLYSKDAHSVIKQSFTAEGQEFEPKNVKDFLKNRAKKQPDLMAQFDQLIEQVITETKSNKYNSLLNKSFYATDLDITREFEKTGITASGKVVHLLNSDIKDTDIKITDKDLEKYLSKHKKDFQQEASRDIEYATFQIKPSKEDTLASKKECEDLIINFKNTESDSLFVEVNSDKSYNNQYSTRGSNAKEIEKIIFRAVKDSIYGPIYYAGGYSLVKLLDSKKDSSTVYENIHRVEIAIKGSTKADTIAAIAEAKLLSQAVRGNSNYEKIIEQWISEGRAKYQTDMGWVVKGQYPDDVKSTINSMNAGDASFISSKAYGIGVLIMPEPRGNSKVLFAEVRKNIEPLKETEENSYMLAQNFRNQLVTGKSDEFDKIIEKNKIAKNQAKKIKEDMKIIDGIANAEEIVRWLYNEDRDVNDYSDIIQLDRALFVVKASKIRKKGTAEVEDVREELTKLVINEKKTEIQKAKMDEALKNNKTIDDIAKAIKTNVIDIEGASIMYEDLGGSGSDKKLVGIAMGMKPKTLSNTIVGKNGVHVIYIEKYNKQEFNNIIKETFKGMYQNDKNAIQDNLVNSLKSYHGVEDNRFKYK